MRQGHSKFMEMVITMCVLWISQDCMSKLHCKLSIKTSVPTHFDAVLLLNHALQTNKSIYFWKL